jgi:hypothetical protein
MWTSVLNVHRTLHSFCLEFLRYFLCLDHWPNHVEYGMILSFGNSILLWCHNWFSETFGQPCWALSLSLNQLWHFYEDTKFFDRTYEQHNETWVYNVNTPDYNVSIRSWSAWNQKTIALILITTFPKKKCKCSNFIEQKELLFSTDNLKKRLELNILYHL